MTAINPLSQLRAEDYPEQKDTFNRLFFTVNPFFTSLTQMAQKGITFGDNVTGQEKTLTFTYIGTATLPLTFAFDFKATPRELWVAQALEGGTPFIALIAWSTDGSTISITDIVKVSSTAGVSALTVGQSYQIIIRITP
jgi:hypothetical protein